MARRYSKRTTKNYRSKTSKGRTRPSRSSSGRKAYTGGRRIELVIRHEQGQPGVVSLPGMAPAVQTGAMRKARF